MIGRRLAAGLVLLDLPANALVRFARAELTHARWVDDDSLLLRAEDVNHLGSQEMRLDFWKRASALLARRLDAP